MYNIFEKLINCHGLLEWLYGNLIKLNLRMDFDRQHFEYCTMLSKNGKNLKKIIIYLVENAQYSTLSVEIF